MRGVMDVGRSPQERGRVSEDDAGRRNDGLRAGGLDLLGERLGRMGRERSGSAVGPVGGLERAWRAGAGSGPAALALRDGGDHGRVHRSPRLATE